MDKKDFEKALMLGNEDYVAIRIKGNAYGGCGDMLVMGHDCLIMHVTGSILCDTEAFPLDENAEITILAKLGESEGAAVITSSGREFSTELNHVAFKLVVDFSEKNFKNETPPKAWLMLLAYSPEKGSLAFKLIDNTNRRWQWETLMN